MARLSVQLLTFRQGQEALRILGFPGEPLLAQKGAMAVELWQAGHLLRFRSKSTEELREKVASQPCNEVRIVRSPEVLQVLEVSPTSSLWAPTGDTPVPNRKGESARLSHGSRAGMIRWNGIDQYPTLLETVFEREERSEVSRLCRLLRDSVPEDLWHEPLTGAADFLPEQGIPLNVLQRMAPWPKAIPALAERFDDLHPILIGPADRCRALADALGAGEVHACGDGPSTLAFLGLGEEVARDPAARERARSWLVPRDSSTGRRDFDPKAGELRFGGNLFLTVRRREELNRQSLLPAPPEGWIAWPIVEPKYLDLLGIPAEEMLTGLASADRVRQIREEIDLEYQKLSGVEPLARRVWQTHRNVYESKGSGLFGRGLDDLLSWVEQRYFSVRNEG